MAVEPLHGLALVSSLSSGHFFLGPSLSFSSRIPSARNALPQTCLHLVAPLSGLGCQSLREAFSDPSN